MKNAALLLLPLAAFFFCGGCRTTEPVGRIVPDARSPASLSPTNPAHTYAASPHKIVGYILAIDESRDFAVIDLTADPPPAELRDGTALTVRTRDLRKTARLTASRFLRGHTLGATILSGLPAVGEEVVLAAD
jgi:hypothetical protein